MNLYDRAERAVDRLVARFEEGLEGPGDEDTCTCIQCEGDARAEASEPEGYDLDRAETYFYGTPDYDRFGRPSWGEEDPF